jgi:NAD(P)-dependent dehydrogenase (short-subunit alcohol dehydrogenase family)
MTMYHSTYARNAMATAAAVAGGLAIRELLARHNEVDLVDKVALVAGGSRGLGLAIARELAEEGCRVAICARNAEELDVAARDLRERGVEVLPVMCDVRKEQEVNAMVEQVEAQLGRIDLLFTVAGIIDVAMVEDLTADDFRRAMDVMFWGALYPILAVLPGMRSRKSGRVVVVTSIGGKISVPHLLAYSTAKFAATGLAEGLAAELARDGIQVTTIVPGLMMTGSHIKATFTGSDEQQRADYTWFSLGATSPVAPRADRAARTIIRAVKRGETERIFPLPFAIASRVHGLMPGLTVRLMRLANAALPSYPASGEAWTMKGEDVEPQIHSRAYHVATSLGREAEATFNQRISRDDPGIETLTDPQAS